MALQGALQEAFGPGRSVRVQLPLALDPACEPEPDIAVVEGTWRDYVDAHPSSAVLVVEVALTTLAYARRRKASLYARAGIPDYWVIDLRDRRVEVRRDPAPREDARYGFDYATVDRLAVGRSVVPQHAGGAAVAVVDLLP